MRKVKNGGDEMLVRYSVQETLIFSGEMDISEEEYENWKDKSDDLLGDFILDHVDREDPQHFSVDSVDEFEKVKK